ncbi:MAG: GNAT family N-acetyltransferase [Brevinema sp.]
MLQENTPTIHTERLILRKFHQNDIDSLFELLSDREVNTFLPWFPLNTLSETEFFLKERFLVYYQLPKGYRYAICKKTDDKAIGYVWLSNQENHDLGYALKKEFWHQGIVTEAVQAVVDRIKQSGYPYITATHDVNNPYSGEVMKKLGMQYQYSYLEKVQPKDMFVVFRMYQLNFDEARVYQRYRDQYPNFIEDNI